MKKYKVKEVIKMLIDDGWVKCYTKETIGSSNILLKKER